MTLNGSRQFFPLLPDKATNPAMTLAIAVPVPPSEHWLCWLS